MYISRMRHNCLQSAYEKTLVKFHHVSGPFLRAVPLDVVKAFAYLNVININSTFKTFHLF
jgi:hypothetical protein